MQGRASSESKTVACNLGACPAAVNGNWGSWGASSECSVTCGPGTHTHDRFCNSPPPSNGGLLCQLTNSQVRAGRETRNAACNNGQCPSRVAIDGNWGPWVPSSQCSVSCGPGTHTHVRQCNNPPASNGGLKCLLTNSQSRDTTETKAVSCNLRDCNVASEDGNWGAWRTIVECSVTCGQGSRTKERNCDSPRPSGDGLACLRINGNRVLQERWVETCNLPACPRTCAELVCHKHARCQENNGNAQCVCMNGFTGTGEQCTDINECNDPNKCPSGSTCVNTIGSYRCDCVKGYELKDGACTDINECHHDPDKFCPNAVCLNLPGSYRCICKPGFVALTTNVCSDINECTSGTHDCHLHATCTNTLSSYTCKCNDGYQGDGKVCTTAGAWNDWSTWTQCSATCNFGVKHRHRTCTRTDFTGCSGLTSETTNCFVSICPPLASWGMWGSWTTCSGTCGAGEKTRTRMCDQVSCGAGTAKETAVCNDGCRMSTCPDNANSKMRCDFESDCEFLMANAGENTEVWSIAKKTPTANTGPEGDHTFSTGCGHFVYFEASHIGKGQDSYMVSPVISAATQTKYCLSFYLSMYSPIESEMGSLSVHCWQGQTVKSIWHNSGVITYNSSHWKPVNIDVTVASNTPFTFMFKGVRGSGFHSDIALDDIQLVEDFCVGQVDGHWGAWGNWESCSVTCGGGRRQKKRVCDSPAPRNGGLQCIGDPTKAEDCNLGVCPVDGNWAQWTAWGSCSKSCGGGLSVRSRECGDPAPVGRGAKCERKDKSIGSLETERKICSQNLCPRDGNWGQWSPYGSCSVTCGSGIQSRSRFCNNPIATGDGKKCLVSNRGGVEIRRVFHSETTPCTFRSCPIDGNWGAWSDWLSCSTTCGAGVEVRSRTCSNPATANGGRPCPGAFSESRACNVAQCVANGTWSQWADWGACSMSCGGGTRSRTRQCLNLGLNKNSLCPRGDGVMDTVETGLGYCNSKICDRNGNWGLWSSYSPCSLTCGNGFQTRTRLCNDPPAIGNGRDCGLINGGTGKIESQRLRCFMTSCPVDGNWGSWTTSVACNVTCGNGHMTRSRTCNNPSPSNGGKVCPPSQGNNIGMTESRVEPCNLGICPVNGNWGAWNTVVDCSVTCGTGVQTRSRLCNNPSASSQGLWCVLSDGSGQRDSRETKVETCTRNLCAVNGNWGSWNIGSTCSVTCGEGVQTKVRHCNNPAPMNGGFSCVAGNGTRSSRETASESCSRKECPIHGNWGGWNETSGCSVTCGVGAITKTRHCNSPAPSNGGMSCHLSDGSGRRDSRETVRDSCSLAACPMNGAWNRWSSLTPCSASCGNGQQTRIRYCNSPAPVGNGLHCLVSPNSNIRLSLERVVIACNRGSCPVHGNWGAWTLHTDCTETCGSGIRTMVRLCNNPSVANGGEYCQTLHGHRDSRETKTESCTLAPCPLDGNWGQWTSTPCNVTCGNGIQVKTRQCNSPAPQTGGRSCMLSNSNQRASTESITVACGRGFCPVHGNWGLWSITGCSVSCGTGVQTKSRLCNSPSNSNGGLACELSTRPGERDARETLIQRCTQPACPLHGNWGAWTTSKSCNVTCGSGHETKTRQCNNPAPLNGGMHCKLTGSDQRFHTESMTVVCNRQLCPVNGNWGLWSTTGCSVTCGTGTQTRTRVCDSPAAVNNGLACLLSSGNGVRDTRETIIQSCGSAACPINGNWGLWSIAEPCDVTCGDGTQRKTRQCNSPSASNGGLDCKFTNSELRGQIEDIRVACSRSRCPLDGNWGAWTITASCSVTCGSGFQSKSRECNNPPAQSGGLSCRLSDGSGNRDIRETVREACARAACPGHGNWGPWSISQACNVTCGQGHLTRTRLCNSPSASNGGLDCKLTGIDQRSKTESQVVTCTRGNCPINGNWGLWSTTGCSVTCGTGTRSKTRLCNSPSASNGGLSCQLSSGNGRDIRETLSEPCALPLCPVNGNWGAWSIAEPCNVTCGVGQQRVFRQCNNPPSSNGGLACKLSGSNLRASSESIFQICNRALCPVNGNWGAWTITSGCSVSCGTGSLTKTRECNNPSAANGGLFCVLSDGSGRRDSREVLSEQCTLAACAVDGNWGAWRLSGTCSVTCGAGLQQRVRNCNNPAASNGGLDCLLTNQAGLRGKDETDAIPCERGNCAVDGNWGTWTAGVCSKTCGNGDLVRERFCNSPAPLDGGLACILSNSGNTRALRETITETCNIRACAVDGNWGVWTTVGVCSRTCGNGILLRERLCNNPTPSDGGSACLLTNSLTERGVRETRSDNCNLRACPVNGNWGQWRSSSACSVTCGNGFFSRVRDCNDPVPSNNGLLCELTNGNGARGSTETDSQPCSTGVPCVVRVDGNWGVWTAGACSKTCGAGQLTRERRCNNPPASGGGLSCLVSGSDSRRATVETITQACNDRSCPVDGNWGQWRSSSACSVTCGNGFFTRVRDCNNPEASNNGLLCLLTNGNGARGSTETDSQPCSSGVPCVVRVDGNWGQWSSLTSCDVSCGNGFRSKTRHCSSPVPQNGGSACVMSNGSGVRALIETIPEPCATGVVCPVNGNWGLWTAFSQCSVSCGNGLRTRDRFCNNPLPVGNGLACTLTNSNERATIEREQQACTMQSCPVVVNGNWGQWTRTGTCSVTCGSGTQTKVRECNDPAPQNGGLSCLFSLTSNMRAMKDTTTEVCTLADCVVVVANWGDWRDSGTCSTTCGNGLQRRVRDCNNPAPATGGLACVLSNGSGDRAVQETLSVQCNLRDCPALVAIDGNWGNWIPSACSVTCGEGTRTVERFCNNPPPSNNGLACVYGPTTRAMVETKTERCSDAATCGVVVNGNWGNWGAPTTCSATCGNGIQTRERLCNNPPSSNGGLECILSSGTSRATREVVEQRCSVADCPVIVAVNGNWGDWSALSLCSATCGDGIQTRERLCNNPPSSNGGLDCMLSSGTSRATREVFQQICRVADCPVTVAVNGNWGIWGPLGDCSATCGQGSRSRIRLCNSPSASNGGLTCLRSDGSGLRAELEAETLTCNLAACPSTTGSGTGYNCSITNNGVLGCDWKIILDGTKVTPNVDIMPWIYGSGRSSLENTGPSGDADGSGWYIYVNSSSAINKEARIESPLINAGEYCLRFKYHMHGTGQGMLGVLVYDTAGNIIKFSSNQDLLWSVFGNRGNQWNEQAIDVNTAQTFKFHISYWRMAEPLSDGALDDIRLTTGKCNP